MITNTNNKYQDHDSIYVYVDPDLWGDPEHCKSTSSILIFIDSILVG
jgi:hypothetical protein